MIAADVSVDHRRDCPAHEVGTFRGQRGDLMARCRNCGRVRPLDDPDATPHAPEWAAPASLDAADRRQTERSGAGWPTHRARSRNRRRSARAAQGRRAR